MEHRFIDEAVWYYVGSKPLFSAELQKAVAKFEMKKGEPPTLLFVDPAQYDARQAVKVEGRFGIKVVTQETVLMNHIKLRRNDEEDKQGQDTSADTGGSCTAVRVSADGSCPLVPVRDTVSGEQLALNGCGFWEPTHPALDDTFEGGCYA